MSVIFACMLMICGCNDEANINVNDTDRANTEDKKILMPDFPTDAKVGEPILLRWDATDLEGTISKTNVLYGRTSISEPDAEDYQNETMAQCEEKPCTMRTFTDAIIFNEPGTYYVRAYAVIDGEDVWSDENQLVVTDEETNTTNAENQDVIVDKNETGGADEGKNITFVSAPIEASILEETTIVWRINSEAATTNHTSVHFGPESVPNPISPEDYPNSTNYQCQDTPCKVPGAFSDKITFGKAGTYYYRAHADVEGIQVWSDEKKIVVSGDNQTTKTQSDDEETDDEGTKEIDVDENGFYINSQKKTSIEVKSGDTAKLKFNALTGNLNSTGLVLKGCDQDEVEIAPGETETMSFKANKDCTIEAFYKGQNESIAELDIEIE